MMSFLSKTDYCISRIMQQIQVISTFFGEIYIQVEKLEAEQ